MPNHKDSRQEPSHPEVCLPVQTPLAGQNSTRSPHQSQPIPISDMAPPHLKAAQGTPVAKLIVPPKEARPGENNLAKFIPHTQQLQARKRAGWQSIASMRPHTPLPPTEPRQGCERTAQLSQKKRSPSQARVPTSTTHERKRVCRWEARAWPQLDRVTLLYATKAHGQGGRRRLPAIHGRRWQAYWDYPASRLNERATRRTVV